MADYSVNYNINVNSQQALSSIQSFQAATAQLGVCGDQLLAFQNTIATTQSQFAQMAKNVPKLGVDTKSANEKLNRIIKKLEKIQTLSAQATSLNVGAASGGGGNGKGKNAPAPAPAPAPKPPKPSKPVPVMSSATKNLSYRALGPTMLDSGGIEIGRASCRERV